MFLPHKVTRFDSYILIDPICSAILDGDRPAGMLMIGVGPDIAGPKRRDETVHVLPVIRPYASFPAANKMRLTSSSEGMDHPNWKPSTGLHEHVETPRRTCPGRSNTVIMRSFSVNNLEFVYMRKVKKSDLKKVAKILNVELPENCEILVHDLDAAPANKPPVGKGARGKVLGKVDVLTVRSLGAAYSGISTPDKTALYEGDVSM